MQVEVSKHTEGSKDKMLRPNGLPESLIRYDGIALHLLNSLFSFLFGSTLLSFIEKCSVSFSYTVFYSCISSTCLLFISIYA
jgi:hypothetical protein